MGGSLAAEGGHRRGTRCSPRRQSGGRVPTPGRRRAVPERVGCKNPGGFIREERKWGPAARLDGRAFAEGGQTDLSTPRCASRHALRDRLVSALRPFSEEFRKRLARFGSDLHPEKTRLIEFGRFAQANRKARGEGAPETFKFLGFTRRCGTNSRGNFTVWRQTAWKRPEAKLRHVKQTLRAGMREPAP